MIRRLVILLLICVVSYGHPANREEQGRDLEIPTIARSSSNEGIPTIPRVSSNSRIPTIPRDYIQKRRFVSRSENGNGENSRQPLFKYKWLSADGVIHNQRGQGHFEIAATRGVSDEAHARAISLVRGVTQHMPGEVFRLLSQRASVGVFTDLEKTTFYPEYARLRDRPECEGGVCSGDCHNTCTADGRKYDSLAGVGGQRATCLDDNLMCTPDDPYHGTHSILLHEFAHTIEQYGLSDNSGYNQRIVQAYSEAKRQSTWTSNSYAMVDHSEYFAEATTVFFNVNTDATSSGGMNRCANSGATFCSSEAQARDWLQFKDPALFEILSYVYTDHHPTLYGGVTVCPPGLQPAAGQNSNDYGYNYVLLTN